MVKACHNCKDGPGPACLRCKRISQDDIRIKKTPKNIRPDLTVTHSTAGSAKVTDLPDETENKLRQLICAFVDLDQLEVVSALHLARRGTARTLPGAIAKYAEGVRRYKMNRATFFEKQKAMSALLPPLATTKLWKEHKCKNP